MPLCEHRTAAVGVAPDLVLTAFMCRIRIIIFYNQAEDSG